MHYELCIVHSYPIGYDVFPLWSEDAFGMELYSPDVIVFVSQGHNLMFVTFCRYLEACGEGSSVNDPRVVASHSDA